MINDEVRSFIEALGAAMVASTDAGGRPHLALGSGLKVIDGEHVCFENWFCPTTLSNVATNPRVAVAVMSEEPPIGYQLIGRVVHGSDIALLGGYRPGTGGDGGLQALTQLVVRVEEVLAFCSGSHTDLPVRG